MNTNDDRFTLSFHERQQNDCKKLIADGTIRVLRSHLVKSCNMMTPVTYEDQNLVLVVSSDHCCW
jgi:phage replication-related protein YjqB (UPF0714/DUF867 family)